MDFTGPAARGEQRRVIVAIAVVGNHTFFFKLQGPAATLEAQKDAFVKFLASVEFSGDVI